MSLLGALTLNNSQMTGQSIGLRPLLGIVFQKRGYEWMEEIGQGFLLW